MSNSKRRLQKVNKQQFIVLILVVLAVVAYLMFFSDRPRTIDLHFTLPDGSQTTTFHATVAASDQERSKGLMFVKELPANKGMFFIFPEEAVQSFWMKNTYLALDIIFVNSDYQVVGIVHSAKPLSTKMRSVEKPSRYVLELNAGQAKEHKIAEGAKLVVNNGLSIIDNK